MDEPEEFFQWIDDLITRARSLGDEAEARELIAFKSESIDRARRAAEERNRPVALSSVLGALDVKFAK